ncbi:VanZ family protein [candidate division KSB1 bacterium]|nr:VanZ family protein [candidate division KSB1 bacterium]
MKFVKWELPLILWTCILLALTWYPRVEIPDLGINAEDKIAHIIVFAVWGVLMSRSVSKYEIKQMPFAVKVTILTGTLFAIVDESAQIVIPGRYFTFYDGIANILGIWLSPVVFHYIVLPLKRRFSLK